jgi:hypothetical protein
MREIFLLIFFIFINYFSYSQDLNWNSAKEKNVNKPLMFKEFADTIDTHPGLLTIVFNTQLNQKVTLPVMNNMIIKGKVNIFHTTPEYQSISIESEEKPGLRLIISKNIEGKYIGVIGCVKHKDIFILYEKENNQYYWIKKEYADLIPD